MAVKHREKRHVLTGGLIMITLGMLIILGKMNIWSFGQSWPLLLIVVALGTLLQRRNDLGGWVIGGVGLIFLFSENMEVKIYAIASLLLPLLLILMGINILVKYFRKNGDDTGSDDDPDRPEAP